MRETRLLGNDDDAATAPEPPGGAVEAVLGSSLQTPLPRLSSITPATEDDVAVITRTMKRPPRGLIGIARRSADGLPVVALVAPVVETKPFPTLYYLVDRTFIKYVGTLEVENTSRVIEDAIRSDDNLCYRAMADNINHIRRRWEYIGDLQTLSRTLRPSEVAKLLTTGIGGNARFTTVRCLHMHVAHWLAECDSAGSAIGQIAVDMLRCRWWPDDPTMGLAFH
eukprot:GHVU01041812.1.p1 GENE.GHVU01041812.1~~GHVU01041812.1.p1  ORF type:complete len:224 (+),score=31.22 GHVU01041812.1:337-1008(+)